MMKKIALLAAAAALLMSCVTSAPVQNRAPMSDIAGIRLDMPRDAVRSSLANNARLAREERRRHEIWTLNDDPRFASLIVGYTPEWNVRFVTAVARPDGVAMHYEDVIELASAEHRVAGQTHTYTWATASLATS
jgi:hypothetical protein